MNPVRVIGKNLVVATDTPGQLRAVFPSMKEAVIQGATYCAVPLSLDSARVLRNLGYEAPSPIRHIYDWPGAFKPRWYQEDTAEFFTLNPRCHCHNAPRTGKTLSALWAADYLRRTGKIHSVLIVAPLSTLWDVWETNIFTHFPLRTFAILHHSKRERRLEKLAQPKHFYVVNHNGCGMIEQALRTRPDIDLVIIDEVAEFFNHKTPTLWKPLNLILNRHGHIRWAWGLTGTPTPEGRPTDAYGQCKLVTPGNYNDTFTHFKSETMIQVRKFKWVPKRDSEKRVQELLSPAIRFDRSVCTDMEPCLIERRAELSDEQKKHYNELLRRAVTTIDGSAVTAVNAGVLIQKLVQTACGVVYGTNGSVNKIDFGPRLRVLEELIAQNNEKVLVFVPFTGVLEALAKELRKRWSVAVIEGDVTPSKRTEIYRAFRAAKDPHVIVAHPACMAHGLDMTTASLTIWYAPVHANKHYEQACARIDGSAQKVKVDIAHIYATAEERRIYQTLRDKGRAQDVVLELIKKGAGT